MVAIAMGARSDQKAATSHAPNRSRAARRTATALGAVAVLLAAGLGWLFVLRGEHADPGLTGREQAAVDAASRAMINLQTFRRAHFDADYTRAAGGLTGQLRREFTSKKSALQRSLDTSRQDTAADVTQAAFEQSKGDAALVLLTMNNYRVDAGGRRTLFGSGRFEVTMQLVHGRWMASNLTSVGLI